MKIYKQKKAALFFLFAIILISSAIAQTAEVTEIGEEVERFGTRIGENIDERSIYGKELQLQKQDSISTVTFTGDDSYLNVKDDLFKNIKKQDDETNAYLKLSEDGEILEADVTSSKATSFTFGSDTVDVPANTRVFYKDEKMHIYGEENSEINFKEKDADGNFIVNEKIKLGDNKKVSIIEDTIGELKAKSFIGKDFEIGDIKVEGFGSVVPTENGKILKQGNTASFKGSNVKIEALEGDFLLVKEREWYTKDFDEKIKDYGEKFIVYTEREGRPQIFSVNTGDSSKGIKLDDGIREVTFRKSNRDGSDLIITTLKEELIKEGAFAPIAVETYSGYIYTNYPSDENLLAKKYWLEYSELPEFAKDIQIEDGRFTDVGEGKPKNIVLREHQSMDDRLSKLPPGEIEKLEEYSEKMIEKGGKRWVSSPKSDYIKSADAAWKAGNFEKMNEAYQKILDLNDEKLKHFDPNEPVIPHTPELLTESARIAERMNNQELANDYWSKLSQYYESKGKEQDTRTQFSMERKVIVYKRLVFPYEQAADAALKEGNKERAREMYKKAFGQLKIEKYRTYEPEDLLGPVSELILGGYTHDLNKEAYFAKRAELAENAGLYADAIKELANLLAVTEDPVKQEVIKQRTEVLSEQSP